MKRYIRAVAGVIATLADGTDTVLTAFDGRAIKRTQYDKSQDKIAVLVEDAPGKPGILLLMTPAAYNLSKVDGTPSCAATTGNPKWVCQNLSVEPTANSSTS